MSLLRLPSLGLALAAVVFASPLVAAPGPFEQTYRDAVKAESSGDVVGALGTFEAIPAGSRDFLVRLHIASCKRKLARFLESAKELEAILADPRIDEATRETAQSDLDDLRAHTPKLFVRLSVATTGIEVALDGEAIAVPVTRLLNPGAHLVVARRSGREVFRREVVLAEGMALEVEIDAPAERVAVPAQNVGVEVGGNAVPAGAPSGPARRPVGARDERAGGSVQRTVGWIVVGLGGVAAIGAGAARLEANSAYRDWQASCRSGPCDDEPRTRTRRWDAWTAGGAGIAIAGVGIGAMLLITAPGSLSAVGVRATTGAVTGVEIVGRF
jgi:hypothetical protein